LFVCLFFPYAVMPAVLFILGVSAIICWFHRQQREWHPCPWSGGWKSQEYCCLSWSIIVQHQKLFAGFFFQSHNKGS
jgi:hypothetical protein